MKDIAVESTAAHYNTTKETAEPSAPIEKTYKAREVEGIVDLYFYRRVGFWLARLFALLGCTPTTVTAIGGIFGITAGHLYFYPSLRLNLVGLALHVIANVFDNADGQLARLTNQRSQTGRILDPVVDHLIWVSIYAHLALRLDLAGFSHAIWLLALAAGISHGWQAAAADYCRNAYLYFAKNRDELDSVSDLRAEFRAKAWDREPWLKFLLGLYLNVMREQEILVPGVSRFAQKLAAMFGDRVPDLVRTRYREMALPMFRWWSLLMTNVRMLLLFVLFVVGQPVWYFWAVLTAGNVLLALLLTRQRQITRTLSVSLDSAALSGQV